MNAEEFEQIKNYATVLVGTLHCIVFDDSLFKRITDVLRLAEEMEYYVHHLEIKRNHEARNGFKLKLIA